jgi:hypothetical protein
VSHGQDPGGQGAPRGKRFGLVDAPMIRRVVPDLVEVDLGARRESEAALHRGSAMPALNARTRGPHGDRAEDLLAGGLPQVPEPVHAEAMAAPLPTFRNEDVGLIP